MNNKLIRTMLIILVVIALTGAGTVYFLLKSHNSAAKGPTIDQILKNSVDVTDVTTNLASANYAKMSFKIETDSTGAAAELTKRDFQVRNIIIEELSNLKESDLQGQAGKIKLQNTLKARINQIMQDGNVVQVYITDSLLQ